MRIPRYVKPTAKKESLRRSVSGVFFDDGKKNVLDLRKPQPLIQINFNPIKIFFREHRHNIIVIATVFLSITLLSSFFVTKASVATFHPTTCLGGWNHPHNAAGEPTLPVDSKIEDFNIQNSAFTKDSVSSIYCGGFQGEIPEDVSAKHLKLSFAWSIDDGSVIHNEPQPFDLNSSDNETTDSELDSGEILLDESVDGGEETVSERPEENIVKESVSEPTSNEEVVPAQPDPVVEETIPAPNPPEEVSFWRKIFTSKVQAQEEVQAPAPDPVVEEAPPADEPAGAEDPVVQEVQAPAPDLVVEEEPSPTEPVATEDPVIDEAPSTNEPTEAVDEAPMPEPIPSMSSNNTHEVSDVFLEVAYTLDGTNWNSLGVVSRSAWKDVSFDIPLSSWENISSFQVGLKTVASVDVAPTIYLDAMMLAVEYDDVDLTPDRPTVLLKDASFEDFIVGDNEIAPLHEPTFTISEPDLSTYQIKNLVIENKAVILSDPDGVLGDTSETNSQEPFKKIEEFLEGVFMPTSAKPEIPPDATGSIDISDTEEEPVVIPVTETTAKEFLEGAPLQTEVPEDASGVITVDGENEIQTNAEETEMIQIDEEQSNDETSFLNIFRPRIARAQETEDEQMVKATVLDYLGNTTTIPVSLENVIINGEKKTVVKIVKPDREFRPGKYTLRIALETTQVIFVTEQDFTWGVLAVNADRSIYRPEDEAYLQMAVLTDEGRTICDADLTLTIQDPNGGTTILDTDDLSIVREPQCGPDNVIGVPDYYGYYTVPTITGLYQMNLTAHTQNGTKTINDTFLVETNPVFDVQRSGPTRIYPVADYPMTIRVTSPVDWQGVVMERMPATFQPLQPQNSQPFDSVQTVGDEKHVFWNVNLVAGQETVLGYIFDSPDISPEFFLLGPAEFYTQGSVPGTDSPVFEEERSWQIASDAVCSSTGTGLWNTPGTWTCGNVPTNADSVVIGPGHVVTMDVNSAVSLLGVNIRGTLDTSGSNYSLTTANVVINAGGTLTANASTITLTGIGTVFSNNGGTFNAGTSTIAATGNGTVTLFNTSITVYNLEITPTITANRVYNVSPAGTLVTVNGNFTSNPTAASAFTVTTVPSTGGLTVVGDVLLTGTTLGRSTLDTSAVNNAPLSVGRVNIVTNSTLNIRNSLFTVTGTTGTLLTRTGTFSAGGTSVTQIVPDADITITDNSTWTFNTLRLRPVITADRTYQFGGGNITISALGSFAVMPDAGTTFTLRARLGAVITVNAATSTTIMGVNAALGVLDTTTSNFALTTGILDIQNQGTLDANGSTISLTGTNGSPFVTPTGTFIAGTSLVTYTGSNGVAAPTFIESAVTYYDLSINNAAETYAQNGIVTGNTAGTLTISNGVFDTLNNNLNFGKISINNSASARLVANASTITLDATSGNLFARGASGIFNEGTSNVMVTSATGSPTFLTSATTFHMVTIQAAADVINSGNALSFSNANPTNMLYIRAGAFNDGGNQITGTVNGTLQIDAGATLCIGGTSASTLSTCDTGTAPTTATTLPVFNSYVLDPSSNVRYAANANMTVTPVTYGNLHLAPRIGTTNKTYTFAGPLTVAGDFNILPSNGAPLLTVNLGGDISVVGNTVISASGLASSLLDLRPVGTDFNLTTSSIDIGTAGTLDAGSAASLITVTGTTGTLFNNDGAFITAGGTSTTEFNGTGTATIIDGTGTQTFYNLTSSGAGTMTLAVDIVVNGNMIVSAGTFAASTFVTTIAGTSGTPMSIIGIFDPGTGEVIFTGDNPGGNTSVPAINYYNLTFNNGAEIYELAGFVIVDPAGTFKITDGTVDTLNNPLTVGKILIENSISARLFAGASSIVLNATSGTLFTRQTAGGFSSGTSTVRFTSNANVTLTAGDFTGTNSFYGLSLAPNTTANRQYIFGPDPINVNENFIISPRDPSPNTLAVDMNADITVVGTTRISGLIAALSILDTNSSSGFAITTGTMDIQSPGTLIANSSIITVQQDWSNAGVTNFIAGNSKVIFTAAMCTFIVVSDCGAVNVTGPTDFFQLIISDAGNRVFSFSEIVTDIIGISDLFSVSTIPSHSITLQSNNPGQQWHIFPTGTTSVDSVNVMDGGCEIGSILIHPTNAVDLGNNDSCWGLTPILTFDMSDATVGFGALTASMSTYATGSLAGSGSEIEAHNFQVSSNANNGYTVSVIGDTLISGLNSIAAIGGVNTAPAPGTQQFGIRIVPTSGNGTVDAPYAASGFAFDATSSNADQVASQVVGDGIVTTYSVRYLGNIDGTVPAGTYQTTLTYLVTANF